MGGERLLLGQLAKTTDGTGNAERGMSAVEFMRLPRVIGVTHLRTVAAAVVETVHAPPAVVFLQALQCQMPTAVRLTESCVG